jgi:hypothetical protein
LPIPWKLTLAATLLLLLGAPLSGRAQTPETTLDSYLQQSVGDAQSPGPATIAEWAIRHPGEVVDAPADKDRDYDAGDARQRRDRELEGRWCLRSTAQISLAGGVHVRRIALFYQPLVVGIYDRPLPPLPTETGDALRRHGCRLVRILNEFEGADDQQSLAETIAKQIPGERSEVSDKYIGDSGEDFWKPLYSIDSPGRSNYSYSQCILFIRRSSVHTAKESSPGQQPGVLLEWDYIYRDFDSMTDYGPPSREITIDPEAGQPWLAMRAAMLARLPQAPTLAMLSFLAPQPTPQQGDRDEQPPFHCRKQLVPVLRTWMGLAARSAPQQHAAALLLADQVLRRLSDCDEFADQTYDMTSDMPEYQDDSDVALRKDLNALGIETDKSARPGPEYYAGNLLPQVSKLAPTGVVNELHEMAILDDRCQWTGFRDADCTNITKVGESFLLRFPQDEWTPSVHLILAEAYSITAAQESGEDDFGTPYPARADDLRKAEEHYRAWYAKSENERDRPLVWQEIWAIDAGMGSWLMVPSELRQ